MASNHTKASAITERIAAEYFWEHGYKNKYSGMSKKVFLQKEREIKKNLIRQHDYDYYFYELANDNVRTT